MIPSASPPVILGEPPVVLYAGLRLSIFLNRGQVLKLMSITNSGGRHTFDKWTKGEHPALPNVGTCCRARYRRSDVLRVIQPGDGHP